MTGSRRQRMAERSTRALRSVRCPAPTPTKPDLVAGLLGRTIPPIALEESFRSPLNLGEAHVCGLAHSLLLSGKPARPRW